MFFCCVCCVGSGLSDELISHSEEFYRVCMSSCVRSRNRNNEAAKGEVGPLYLRSTRPISNEVSERND